VGTEELESGLSDQDAVSPLLSRKKKINNFYLKCVNGKKYIYSGFRTVMENLEKSWNFNMVISRPGNVMEKT